MQGVGGMYIVANYQPSSLQLVVETTNNNHLILMNQFSNSYSSSAENLVVCDNLFTDSMLLK